MEDPWVTAMEESWNQMSKARDFLMTETSEEVAVVIAALFKSQESSDYKGARAVYECRVANFADFLTLKRVLKSAKVVVKKGMGELVDRGIEDLKMFLARDGTLCKYNKDQRTFVADLAFKIAYCHKTKKESDKVAREISHVLRNPKMYDDHITGFDIDWCDHLANLSSLEILIIFAETDLEERSRELAIRRLNLLLSKVVIDVSVIRQLQPLLISCLKEDRLSDSMFKILGEVVFHVANEILSYQEEEEEDTTWFHLWDYIVSQCKTQFEKAVYIFQSLTMMHAEYNLFFFF